MTASGPIRALVVDESDRFAERTARTLTKEYDIDATHETSTTEALAFLEDGGVDCVVSDYEMPGMDGLAFLGRVRDRFGDLPVVFLVGRGEEGVAGEVLAADGVDYLLKLEITEVEQYRRLADRIESVVARRRTGRTDEQPADTHPDATGDVTARRECEAELERQTERLERLAGVVSHDLRNPLNVAQSSVELLETDSDHVERIERSLDRMEAIIADVVALAREGDPVEEPSPVHLPTVAEDAWSDVETADATLVVDADRRIAADPDRLKDLFRHLFANAVEHGDASTVTVGAREGGFFVADDGSGIPEDRRSEAFETGYSTARQGTGLGLSIVEEIATAHSWTVDLAESEDGGARFDVTGVTDR